MHQLIKYDVFFNLYSRPKYNPLLHNQTHIRLFGYPPTPPPNTIRSTMNLGASAKMDTDEKVKLYIYFRRTCLKRWGCLPLADTNLTLEAASGLRRLHVFNVIIRTLNQLELLESLTTMAPRTQRWVPWAALVHGPVGSWPMGTKRTICPMGHGCLFGPNGIYNVNRTTIFAYEAYIFSQQTQDFLKTP